MDWILLAKGTAQGVIEGLTEFIPVSSTGHLILLGDAIGFVGDKAATFDVFIQLGAILAVVYLYWDYFTALLRKPGAADVEHRGLSGAQGIWKLFLTCVPALVAGALLHGLIKEKLFNPATVAVGLIVGGVIMIWLESRPHKLKVTRMADVSALQCLVLGGFQCLALWPGMSRSGSTIIGAMLLGFERRVAAEFSFLMAVPIMFAAVAFDMLKSLEFLEAADVPLFAIGFLVSFVVAMLAIKFFMAVLRRYTLRGFGVYRIILGVIVLASVG